MTENGIPEGCDCLWSITYREDGGRSGAVFIASEKCQEFLMHPRTFTEPAPEARDA